MSREVAVLDAVCASVHAQSSHCLLILPGVDGRFTLPMQQLMGLLLGSNGGKRQAFSLSSEGDAAFAVLSLIPRPHLFLYSQERLPLSGGNGSRLVWESGLLRDHSPNGDELEAFKVKHFMAAMARLRTQCHGVLRVLTPLPAGSGARPRQLPLGPDSAPETWPLVQASALQEMGASGFFTQLHDVLDGSQAASAALRLPDAAWAAWLWAQALPAFLHAWTSSLGPLADMAPHSRNDLPVSTAFSSLLTFAELQGMAWEAHSRAEANNLTWLQGISTTGDLVGTSCAMDVPLHHLSALCVGVRDAMSGCAASRIILTARPDALSAANAARAVSHILHSALESVLHGVARASRADSDFAEVVGRALQQPALQESLAPWLALCDLPTPMTHEHVQFQAVLTAPDGYVVFDGSLGETPSSSGVLAVTASLLACPRLPAACRALRVCDSIVLCPTWSTPSELARPVSVLAQAVTRSGATSSHKATQPPGPAATPAAVAAAVPWDAFSRALSEECQCANPTGTCACMRRWAVEAGHAEPTATLTAAAAATHSTLTSTLPQSPTFLCGADVAEAADAIITVCMGGPSTQRDTLLALGAPIPPPTAAAALAGDAGTMRCRSGRPLDTVSGSSHAVLCALSLDDRGGVLDSAVHALASVSLHEHGMCLHAPALGILPLSMQRHVTGARMLSVADLAPARRNLSHMLLSAPAGQHRQLLARLAAASPTVGLPAAPHGRAARVVDAVAGCMASHMATGRAFDEAGRTLPQVLLGTGNSLPPSRPDSPDSDCPSVLALELHTSGTASALQSDLTSACEQLSELPAHSAALARAVAAVTGPAAPDSLDLADLGLGSTGAAPAAIVLCVVLPASHPVRGALSGRMPAWTTSMAASAEARDLVLRSASEASPHAGAGAAAAAVSGIVSPLFLSGSSLDPRAAASAGAVLSPLVTVSRTLACQALVHVTCAAATPASHDSSTGHSTEMLPPFMPVGVSLLAGPNAANTAAVAAAMARATSQHYAWAVVQVSLSPPAVSLTGQHCVSTRGTSWPTGPAPHAQAAVQSALSQALTALTLPDAPATPSRIALEPSGIRIALADPPRPLRVALVLPPEADAGLVAGIIASQCGPPAARRCAALADPAWPVPGRAMCVVQGIVPVLDPADTWTSTRGGEVRADVRSWMCHPATKHAVILQPPSAKAPARAPAPKPVAALPPPVPRTGALSRVLAAGGGSPFSTPSLPLATAASGEVQEQVALQAHAEAKAAKLQAALGLTAEQDTMRDLGRDWLANANPNVRLQSIPHPAGKRVTRDGLIDGSVGHQGWDLALPLEWVRDVAETVPVQQPTPLPECHPDSKDCPAAWDVTVLEVSVHRPLDGTRALRALSALLVDTPGVDSPERCLWPAGTEAPPLGSPVTHIHAVLPLIFSDSGTPNPVWYAVAGSARAGVHLWPADSAPDVVLAAGARTPRTSGAHMPGSIVITCLGPVDVDKALPSFLSTLHAATPAVPATLPTWAIGDIPRPTQQRLVAQRSQGAPLPPGVFFDGVAYRDAMGSVLPGHPAKRSILEGVLAELNPAVNHFNDARQLLEDACFAESAAAEADAAAVAAASDSFQPAALIHSHAALPALPPHWSSEVPSTPDLARALESVLAAGSPSATGAGKQ